MKKLPHIRWQRGDTIVEVLISLLVITFILTGAFVLSRTSAQNVRTSQEHAQALQLLQGQVELLRAYVTTHPFDAVNPINNFCLNPSDDTVAADSTNTCKVDPSGNLAFTYDFSIAEANPADYTSTGLLHQYTATVTWPALGGGTNRETMVYRAAYCDPSNPTGPICV